MCFFLCQAARVLLTYFVYAPLRMLAFRDFRRLLCVCLSLVVRLWRGAHVLRVRSAPRPRLSWLLPFALWQVTSLQAKKQCSRRTTKHNFGCAFFFVRLWARCSRTFVRSAPCPRLPRLVRLAPRLVNVWQEITTPLRMLAFRDFRRLLCVCLSLVVRLWRGAHVLRVRSAPRPRLSWLLPFALWQVTSLQAKKQCSRRTTKARRFAVLFDIKSVDKRCVFRLLFYIRDRG